MSDALSVLEERLRAEFGEAIVGLNRTHDELTLEVTREEWLDIARRLRDSDGLRFDILIDACGVDYAGYGLSEWATDAASDEGFGRGVSDVAAKNTEAANRFAVVYHLLSVQLNQRLRVRVFCEDVSFPVIDSVMSVWRGADWYEREAFDLFGIIFEGHPDLRRILTDYGFVGHPLRKDFPLSGHVEVRYDPQQRRVVYEPVSIEPRVLVPRVVR